jgi:hypothetical protein
MTFDKDFIYESPDGGHTVYRRKIGDNTKELVYEDDYVHKAKLKMEWLEIFDRKDSNPTLQAAVDRVILVHRLTKDHGKT